MEGRSRIEVFISRSMIVGIDEKRQVSLRKLLSNLPVIRGREREKFTYLFPHLRGISPLIPIR